MEITKESVQQEIEKRKSYTTNLKILNKEDFDKSQKELTEIKNIEKQINFLYDDSIKAAKIALDTIKDAKEIFSKPAKEIKDIITKAQREYYFLEEKRRKEAQAELEKKNKEAEEKKRLDEAVKLEEEKKRLIELGKAEEAKIIEKQVVEILDQPGRIQKVEIKPEVKVDKRSFKKIWKFRIVNIDEISREWLIPDEKKLLTFAREKEEAAKVPGVEFYYE